MSEHDFFRDNLDLYLAGGLNADEGLRCERHAAQCAACAQELAKRRLFDRELDRLCSPVQFGRDWDRRVQARWQVTNKPPRRWPAPVKWTAAAAAVLLIGALGAAVNAVAQQGMIAFPGGNAVAGDESLPSMLPVFAMASEEITQPSGAYTRSPGSTQASNHLKQLGLGVQNLNGEVDEFTRSKGATRGDPTVWFDDLRDLREVAGEAKNGTSNTIEFSPPALALRVQGLSKVHAATTGGDVGGKEERKAEKLLAGQFAPFGSVNRNLGVSSTYSNDGAKTHGIANGDSGVDGLALSKRLGGLQKLQENEAAYGFTMGVQLGDGTVRNMNEWSALPRAQAGVDLAAKQDEAIKDLKARKKEEGTPLAIFGRDVKAPPANTPAPAVTRGFGVGESKPSESAARGGDKAEQASKDKMYQLRAGAEYFSIAKQQVAKERGFKDTDGSVAALKQLEKSLDKQSKQLSDLKREEPQSKDKEKASAENAFLNALESKQGPRVELPIVAQQPKQPDPQVAQRKIIRTGDLEFEVSVFDDTVAQITKLIGAIPGAFVATVNSEKLPNGKVKGSVVVRVPPEHLDKFVLDLRQTLAKVGELKSQKIGSADVTKQYTDIESRLRAARTMEERFIAIIKNGKGEVKDLIAAERELGVWRTKIEEMEGEIRYYNNQVGLSTLTITAYEKEIRAAASMVITEQITMKIETDDVEKSLQTSLAAVTEAKGRVTKSDLKQHSAGQLEAILTFEVSPAAAAGVKDKLKALGIVTHHDAQRLTQAEGGVTPMGEPIKSRTDDVRFHVTLYNVANIQPREAYVIQVVVTDVPAEYKKLLDGVTAAKGQVRVSQLDEKDKTNNFAQLDFDVPATQREMFDKILAGLGDVVSRNTTRAGPGESATDKKVGYRLTLKSEAGVPPRETFTLNVYSLDVPAAYRKLQETAAQLKGNVRNLQLNEQDKNNVNAQFDVDLLKADAAALDKLLDEIGDVASRSTSRVQPNEIATERKVGYRLSLRSQIPPRETLDLNLEVTDVDRVAGMLVTLVKNAKGRVTASEVTQDAGGKSVAIQLFDVPLAAKEDLAEKFKAIGKVRGQKAAQNLQAPDGKLATAHINVRLTNLTPIVGPEDGLWPQVRRSLGYAFSLLSVSLMFLIVGVSVLLPWALVVWVGFKVVKRMRNKGQATA